MKLVVFGLSISSSWGNGHATLWRGLAGALAAFGHRVIFFERDVPYYAKHRDYTEIPSGELVLYQRWEEVYRSAERHLQDADAGMVTSYCADAVAAAGVVLSSRVPQKVFYDLDTPVTLAGLRAGRMPDYIGPGGLAGFDLVLSYTGGAAPAELSSRLGARRVEPLYGSADPAVHRPVPARPEYAAGLSYLGTYAPDRQAALEAFLLGPARLRPDLRFLIGGALYPGDLAFPPNVRAVPHVPPPDHPAFYCSSKLTLSITRGAMAEMGHCPSGRLFEASACGAPIVTDYWNGLERFFEPGREIAVARATGDLMDALAMGESDLRRMAAAARARTLECHTAAHRARELERLLSCAREAGAAAVES